MEELILRSLQGRATAQERQQLRQWLSQSTVHEARFREVARIWALTALSRLDEEDDLAPRRFGLLSRRSPSRLRPRHLVRIGVAAAAVLILGFALGRWTGVRGLEAGSPTEIHEPAGRS